MDPLTFFIITLLYTASLLLPGGQIEKKTCELQEISEGVQEPSQINP